IGNTATKVVVTVPTMSLNPGNVGSNGVSGSPAGAVAGAIWIATATITDNYYNPISTAVGHVWIQTSDPYDVDGATQTLINGATTFVMQMYQAGSQSVTVVNQEGAF